jgi:16S rRNA (guanine966-N2)-methyltransferase
VAKARKKTAPEINSGRRRASQLRIVGGVWRGRRLGFPETAELRPTPDRVRETLFNWLQPWIAGAHCLDLFAGSGALGLEALSRGAAQAVLIEQDEAAAQALRANIDKLQAQAADLIHTDAMRYLHGPARAFDIVFLDPPFQSGLLEQCFELLEKQQWIKPGGLVYIENIKTAPELALPPSWQLLRTKSAGQVSYHLARKT